MPAFRSRITAMMTLCWLLHPFLGCRAFTQPGAPSGRAPLRTIEVTCVADQAHGYATFQSHNQKVVANRWGIFMTHIRSRNEPYTAQAWRLSRSTDGGRTFATVHESTDATNPPVIESGPDGDIYLMRVDFVSGDAFLYRFLASNDFRDPLITTIPRGAAGKYAMFLDPKRNRIFYFAHNNTFHVVGLDGRVISSCDLLAPGPNAALQYPLLDVDRDGNLHAAWTTLKHGVYLYWDIHHMLSPDGGATWRNMDGTPVAVPAVADDTGPALRITPDGEFGVHTWLSNFIVKDGKAHFFYMAQTRPPREHYVRYDVKAGRREIDRQPEFRGETLSIRGLDGFFAARTDREGSPLYCLGRDPQGRVVCLVSPDNGDTWHDYARTNATYNVYSLGGCRTVTDDGYIIGSFTDQAGSMATNERRSKVYFLKVPAAGL